jgi:hypothetical protein
LRADLIATFPAAMQIAGDDLSRPTSPRLPERGPAEQLRAASREQLVASARAGTMASRTCSPTTVTAAFRGETFSARDYLACTSAGTIRLTATGPLAIDGQRRVWEKQMRQRKVDASRPRRRRPVDQSEAGDDGKASPGGEIHPTSYPPAYRSQQGSADHRHADPLMTPTFLHTSMADLNAVEIELTYPSSPSARDELPRCRDRRECLVNLGFGVGTQTRREIPIRGGESQPAAGKTQPKLGSPAVMPGPYFCWSNLAGASTGVPFTNVPQAATAPGDQAVAVAVADSEGDAGLDAPTEADNNCGAEVTCRLPPPTSTTSTTAAAMNAMQMPW